MPGPTPQQATAARLARARTTLRLGSLVGGAMGLLGFSLAILLGLRAGNTTPQILYRTIITSCALAAIGGLVGTIISKTILEHMARVAQERESLLAAQAAAQAANPQSGASGPTSRTSQAGQPGQPRRVADGAGP